MKLSVMVICALLVPSLSLGQWAEFDACGRRMQNGTATGESTQKAPNVGPYLVWVPAISVVVGYTEKTRAKQAVSCTMLQMYRERVLVIGSLEDVMQKIRKAECVKRMPRE